MAEPTPKMTLLEAYEQLRVPKRCAMGNLMHSLDEGDREILEAWFADKDMKHAEIARYLQGAGHAVHRDTLTKHRLGRCTCSQ